MKLINKLGSSYNTYADMVNDFVETEAKNLNITTLQTITLIESVENGQLFGNTKRKVCNNTPISDISLAKSLFECADIAIKNIILHELYHIKFFENTYKLIDYNYIYSKAENPKSIEDYILLIGFKAIDEFYATYNAGAEYFYPSITASNVKYPYMLINSYIQTFKAYIECLNVGGSPNIPHLPPKIDECISWIVECVAQSKLNDDVGTQSMNMMVQDKIIGNYVSRVAECIFATFKHNLFTQETFVTCGNSIFSIFQELGGRPVVDNDGIMTLEAT